MKNNLTRTLNPTQPAAFIPLIAVVLICLTSAASAQQISPADQEYFEAKIRPILVDNCYNCHGDGATKGGLDLGSKGGSRAGGNTGSAVVPGDPGKSILIKRIKNLADPMPPSNKDPLTDAQISELESWIRRGAPDPRTGKSAGVIKTQSDREKAKAHWAFHKVKTPTPPLPEYVFNGKLKGWIQNPIDAYILKSLEEQNMVPSLPAEKWALLRRVYFDLIGLPPSYEDIQRFTSGQETYEQVIDRLLASPQYGERWGRYWLDVARYADTTGSDNRRGNVSRYIYAYTYRDWVINSMNEDKPYDKFLIEQIAADQQKTNHGDLAAMGFLTLGRRDRNNEEIIDDRIDVLTRGTLGLAVYCARCHDHKFDPVPTADYYSLYGVFNSSREPDDKTKLKDYVLATGSTSGGDGTYAGRSDVAEYQSKLKTLTADHKQYRLQKEYENNNNSRQFIASYMYWTHMYTKNDIRVRDKRREFESTLDKLMQKATGDKKAKSKIKLKSEVGETWQNYMRRKKEDDRVFGPWVTYGNVSTNAAGRFISAELTKAQAKLRPLLAKPDPKNKRAKRINPIVAKYFPLNNPPANMGEVMKRYDAMFKLADQQWRFAIQQFTAQRAQSKPGEQMDPPKSMADAQKRFGVEYDKQFGKDYAIQMEEIRRVIFERGHPCKSTFDELKRNDRGLENEERDRFLSKIETLKIDHPGSPPLAMVLVDGAPRNERIMIKGNRGQRGKEVPRQFLEILSGDDRKPFPKNTSGRLELAKAIASKENPLTARVMANRIWMLHFGKGIVSSISEFGVRAMDPSHPELLDYLAWYFTTHNWSMKTLHKHILMSNTYQQTSDDNPRYSIKDPNNIYYYKMDRRRLDFEAFRDGMLSISGKADLAMGGKPLRLTGGSPNYRRTVYALIDRRNLDEVFKTFDFANPDKTAGQRFTSTVAQQALFMMNSPMVADLAHQLVNRKEFTSIQDDRARITALYNMIYQRAPEPIELKLGVRYLQQQTGGVTTGAMKSTPTWYNGYGQADRYNEKNKLYSIKFFQFPFTDGKVWKGNSPQFGPLELTATGGHPGSHPNVAVIRRWVAPTDTIVDVRARLEHKLDDTAEAARKDKMNEVLRKFYDDKVWDGITGVIVHSRVANGGARLGKELWRSDVRRTARGTDLSNLTVKRGDTIDFIVYSGKVIDPKALASTKRNYGLENPQQDQFTWNPTVSIKKEIADAINNKAGSLQITSWQASSEFLGSTYKPKPLNAWEKYVQVLLLSNEIAFVD
ncbi:MAG: PSD1 domain-containing protein [Verrucomicrobia subdivision 3 bacterium]|nr:PSD1 domain-containing protein [Limisphaerales bacterium]